MKESLETKLGWSHYWSFCGKFRSGIYLPCMFILLLWFDIDCFAASLLLISNLFFLLWNVCCQQAWKSI